jgi:CobQ-like glutamine amidotransferase family enzyme
MIESVRATHYVIRPKNGPVLFVYDKELAELLLSKAKSKFRQDIRLEICEIQEKDQNRTSH